MKRLFIRLLSVLLVVIAVTACEKPGDSPLSDCVTASVEYKNVMEGTYYQQSNFSDEDFDAYNNLPRTITVPSGTMLKVNAVWNLRKYAVDDAEIDKVYVKTVQGQVERSCSMLVDAQNSLPELTMPAYADMTIHVRFVLKSGEEHTVGPFNITVEADNKVISDVTFSGIGSGGGLLASGVASEQAGLRYLWSPYYVNGFVGLGTSHTAPLESNFNAFTNKNTAASFGLLALSNQGVAANQIKLVASDRIQPLGLYPELVETYGCFLGANYARFEAVTLPIDTANLSASFQTYYENMDFASLNTISITNPQSELVVSKANPCFKFVTSAGKKGYGVVQFTNNSSGSIYFIMQR